MAESSNTMCRWYLETLYRRTHRERYVEENKIDDPTNIVGNTDVTINANDDTTNDDDGEELCHYFLTAAAHQDTWVRETHYQSQIDTDDP
jgi:hypothetical protein